jgi:hypothetical protein
LMGDFDCLPLQLLLAVCLHQSSFLHWELYSQALEKLKRTWDRASLRSKTLRVMLMQLLDTAAVVCKSEHWDFKCLGEIWDSESLRARTFKRD